MLSRMQTIASQEGFTLDDDAGMLIARLADGGMRDALSTLDQCIGRDRHVTAQLVTDVAGITGRDHLFALAAALASHDTASAMEQLNDLHSQSLDMERLCGDLVQHFRNLMIVKTVRRAENVLICTAQELEQYRAQSATMTLETILYAIDLLQETAVTMKKGVDRRVEMELALIRLADPALSTDTNALMTRIAALERAVRTGVSASTAPAPQPEPAPEPAITARPEPQPEPAAAPAKKPPQWETPLAVRQPEAPSKPAPSPEPDEAMAAEPDETPNPEPAAAQPSAAPQNAVREDELFPAWPQVLSELQQFNMPLWGVLNDSAAYERGDFILIKSDNAAVSSFIRISQNARDVKEAIERVTGRKYRLGIYSRPAAPVAAPQEEKQDPLDTLLQKAQQFGVLQE